jgi:hypothetical protein
MLYDWSVYSHVHINRKENIFVLKTHLGVWFYNAGVCRIGSLETMGALQMLLQRCWQMIM